MTNAQTNTQWNDDRLNVLANAVAGNTSSISQLTGRVDHLVSSIEQLVQALYVEFPRVRADVNAIHDELVSANETAKIQAESVRELIRLLNQRQA
jgi:hypothetical protein